MAWLSEHWRGGSGVLFALLLGAWAGCFDGAKASGLPCERDSDCGPTLTCDFDTGCCGGPCTTTTSSTTVDPTSSTSSGTSSTASTSLTPTTDTGSDTNPGDGSTTQGPFCGDGSVDPDEDCEPPVDEDDPWAACLNDCTNAIFHWTQQTEGNADWDKVTEADQWHRVASPTTGPWGAGVYPEVPAEYRLRTRPIDIPTPAAGNEIRVRLEHAHTLDVCSPVGDAEYYDVAHVLLEDASGALIPFMPDPAQTMHTGEVRCMGANRPSLCDDPPVAPLFFVGDSMGSAPAREVAIPATSEGTRVRLVFIVAFGASNCGMPEGDPWRLFEVLVAEVAAG